MTKRAEWTVIRGTTSALLVSAMVAAACKDPAPGSGPGGGTYPLPQGTFVLKQCMPSFSLPPSEQDEKPGPPPCGTYGSSSRVETIDAGHVVFSSGGTAQWFAVMTNTYFSYGGLPAPPPETDTVSWTGTFSVNGSTVTINAPGSTVQMGWGGGSKITYTTVFLSAEYAKQ